MSSWVLFLEPLTVTYQITSQEIASLVRIEKDGRVRQRLTAMKFILQGQTIPLVARRLDVAERPLRKWWQTTQKRYKSYSMFYKTMQEIRMLI
jgi:hypothetical protein